MPTGHGCVKRCDLAFGTSTRERLRRAYTRCAGKPAEAGSQEWPATARFAPLFPTNTYEVNADLCQLLVYFEAPGVADKALGLLARAPSQEEQMEYVKSLSNLKTGWTLEQRKAFFQWFPRAATYKGGQRFQQ